METKAEFTMRHYEPADYPMLKSWWDGHGSEALHEGIVPESTCIVLMDGEPVASGSVFPCNNNLVAFFHGMVTRPGLLIGESRGALLALQAGLDIMMRSSGHTLLLGTVPAGAMLRGARMMGFEEMGGPVQGVGRVVKPLPIENHGS